MTNNITVDAFGGASNATSTVAGVSAGLSNNTTPETFPFNWPEVSSQTNKPPIDWVSIINTSLGDPVDWRKPAQEFNSNFVAIYDGRFVSALVGVCGVLGIVGNILLFTFTFQEELRHHSYSVFLAVMSVCDSLSLVAQMWKFVFFRSGKLREADDNIHECRFVDVLESCFPTASTWILVCFAIDRYIGVVFPLKRVVLCTITRARVESAIVLVACFGLSMYSVSKNQLIPFGKYHLCGLDDIAAADMNSVRFSWAHLVPGLMLLVLSTRTLWAIRSAAQNRLRIGNNVSGIGYEDELLRASLSLLPLPILSIIIILPFQIIRCYLHFTIMDIFVTGKETMSELDTTVMNTIAYLESMYTVNFAVKMYILLATSQAYRNILRRMLRMCIASLATTVATTTTGINVSRP